MSEPIQSYIDVILTQREWSWTLLGILYLFAGLIIRSWFMAPLVSSARALDSKNFKQVKKAYLGGAFFGWLFFFIPLFILCGLWNSELKTLTTPRQLLIILGGVFSFIFSIILHLIAFGRGALYAFRKAVDAPKSP